MPAGRLGVSCGVAAIPPLSHAVNVRSLRRRAKKQAPPPPLTVWELRECRRLLRKFFRIYGIACATPQPSATQRRRTLWGIKKAAAKFAETRSPLWADKLCDRLAASDVNTNDVLYREILSHCYSGKDLMSMKRQLRYLATWHIFRHADAADQAVAADQLNKFDTAGLPIVCLIANIDVDALVPASGRWPDPALANLVAALEPIWTRVTGRTAGLISADRTCESKVCPFADWLRELLGKARLPVPPVGRVFDIVRAK